MSIARPVDGRGARVLVTGSEGFLGHHVRAVLAARGASVVRVDRAGTQADIAVDLADAGLDPAALWREAGRVDAVIYLAASIVRTSSVDATARTNLRVIAEAPVRLMEAAHEASAAPYLMFCSSIKVYGPPHQPLIHPVTHPLRPDPHSYGSAKALSERLLAISSRRTGYTHGVLRSGWIYGPGQHLHNAVPIFLGKALAGEAPRLFGDGTSLRDDMYVADLADLLVEGALRRQVGTFNGAPGDARTIAEVARLCCEAAEPFGAPKGLRPVLDTSQPAKWWLDQIFDSGPTREALDYTPTPMLEGLRAEAAWIADGAVRERSTHFARWQPGAVAAQS